MTEFKFLNNHTVKNKSPLQWRFVSLLSLILCMRRDKNITQQWRMLHIKRDTKNFILVSEFEYSNFEYITVINSQ